MEDKNTFERCQDTSKVIHDEITKMNESREKAHTQIKTLFEKLRSALESHEKDLTEAIDAKTDTAEMAAAVAALDELIAQGEGANEADLIAANTAARGSAKVSTDLSFGPSNDSDIKKALDKILSIGEIEDTKLCLFVDEPKDFAPLNETTGSLELSWSPVELPEGKKPTYTVQVRCPGEAEFDTENIVYTGASTKCSFTGDRAIPDSEYEFRVSAACDGKLSYWTRITAKTLPMPPPAGLKAEDVTAVGLSLVWDPVVVPGGKKVTYELEKKACTGEDIVQINNESEETKEGDENKEKEIGNEKVSHKIYGDLRPETEYAFCVRALCCGKMSEWSEPFNVKTEALPPVTSLVVKEVDAVSMSFAWKPLSLPGNASERITYQAERSKDGISGEGEGDAQKEKEDCAYDAVYDGRETTASTSGLEPETKYALRVRPVCDGQPGVWTAIEAVTKKIPPPTALVVKEVSPITATLTWSAPAGIALEKDAVTYQASFVPKNGSSEEEKESGAEKNVIPVENAFVEESNSYLFVVSGLDLDTEYVLRVRAVWATGAKSAGEWAVVEGKTLSTPAPQNLRAEGTTFSTAALAWDPIELPGKTITYAIERFVGTEDVVKKTPEGEVQSVTKVDKYAPVENTLKDADHTFTVRGLVPDTEHKFRIRAVCCSKASKWASVAARTAVVPPVASFEAAGLSPFSAKLSWTESAEEPEGEGEKVVFAYQAVRVVAAEGEGAEKTVSAYEGGELEAVVAALAPETEYTFKVRKTFQGKVSEWTSANVATLRLPKIASVTAGETTPLTATFTCEIGNEEVMQYAQKVRVEARCAAECEDEAKKGTLHELGKDALITGLVPDTDNTYCFRLNYDGAKFGDWSEGVTVHTLGVPVPVNFAAVADAVTPVAVELAWDSVGPAYSYQVECEGACMVYEGKECRAVARDLVPETEYKFRVRAVFNEEKVSEWVSAEAKTLRVPAPTEFVAPKTAPLSILYTWKEVVLGDAVQPAPQEPPKENADGEAAAEEDAKKEEVPAEEEKKVERVTYKICYEEDSEEKALYEGCGDAKFELCELMPETEYKVKICAIFKGKFSDWVSLSAATAVVPVPTEFAVAEVKPLSLAFTWAKISLPEGVVYKIENVESTDNTEGGEKTSVVYEGEENAFTYSGLSPETQYSLRLCAVYKGEKSSAWAPVSAKTAGVPIPEGFAASEVKPLSLGLTWGRVTLGAGEEEDAAIVYKVERVTKARNAETGEEEEGERTEEIYSGGECAFELGGLMPETKCNFRLCAVYRESTTRAWTKLEASTAKVPAPENFAVGDVKPLSMKLSWSPVTLGGDAAEDAEIAYKVERVECVEGVESTAVVFDGKECEFPFSGLMPDTEYVLRVCAVHRGTKTSDWTKVAAKTAAVPEPKDFVVTGEPTPVSVALKWTPPDDVADSENSVKYEVEQRIKVVPPPAPAPAEGEGENEGEVKSVVVEENAFAPLVKSAECECCAQNLVPETDYEFRVRAVYKGQKVSGWAMASSKTAEVPAPTELVAGDIDSTSLVFTWAKITSIEAQHVKYEVEQHQNGADGDFVSVPLAKEDEGAAGPGAAPKDACRAAMDDLVPDSEYALRVRALCRGKSSAWATLDTRTATLPQVQGVEVASVTAFTLSLRWTPLELRGAGAKTRYQVMPFEDANAVVATEAPELHLDELTPQADYEYRVRAVRRGKAGPWSETVKVTMAQIPPVRNLHTTIIGANNVGLAWEPPAEFSKKVTPIYEVAIGSDEDGEANSVYSGEDAHVRLFDLEALREYLFKARVLFDDDIASEWTELRANTLPQNFDAIEATPVTVRLRWSVIPGIAPADVTYEIERCEGPEPAAIVFTGVAPENCEFVADGLIPDTEYTFRIHALYGGKTSEWVPTGSKTLPVPAPAGCEIVNLGPFAYTIAWQEVPFVTESEDRRYVLTRPGEGEAEGEVVVYEGRDLRTEFTAEMGIVPETFYKYSLYAVHGTKRSEPVTAEVTTPKVPAPGELTVADVAQTSARVAWRPATIAAGALPAGAACVYDLQQRLITNGIGNFGDVGEVVGEYAAEGLAVDSDYEFRVRTRCVTPSAQYCSEWTVAAFHTLPLPPPENFRAEVVRSTSAYLSWSAVEVPGVPQSAIAYDVYGKPSKESDAAYTLYVGGVEEAGDLVEVSGLEADTAYTFRVCSTTVVVSGQKKASEYSTLTLKTAIMHPQTFRTTSITPTTMALAWTAGGALPMTTTSSVKPTYKIEIRVCTEKEDVEEEGGEEGEKEKETLRERLQREEVGYRVLCSGITALKYVAEELDPDTHYALRLRTEAGNGPEEVSDWADLEAATLPIPAPKKLRASNITPVSASLSWAPIPGVPAPLIEYVVERRIVKTNEVYHEVIDEADEPEIIIPEMPSDLGGDDAEAAAAGSTEEAIKRLQERARHEAEVKSRIEAAKRAKRAAEERARLRAENNERREALERAKNFHEVYCGPFPPADGSSALLFDDLVPETEYEYRVCGISTRNGKTGEWAATPVKTQPVPAPQKFKGDNITTTTVTLNWTTSDALPNDVVVYQIEKKLKYAPPEPSEDDYHAPKQSFFWYLLSFIGIGSRTPAIPGTANKKVPCNDPFERIYDGVKAARATSTSASASVTPSSSPAPMEHDDVMDDVNIEKVGESEIVIGEGGITQYTTYGLDKEAIYDFRVRAACRNRYSEWVDTVVEMPKKKFADCTWKRCPRYVDEWGKYIVTGINSRIVTKTGADCSCWRTTVLGDVPLVGGNTINKWSIKVLQSKSDGNSILIGVAPITINQNSGTWSTGWYLDCFSSTLYSGAPQFYHDRQYGPRKSWGKYVLTGDIVDVEMDMKNKKLSFSLGGVEIGVAYDSIPIDIPLVPAVLLGYENDSIELLNPSFFEC